MAEPKHFQPPSSRTTTARYAPSREPAYDERLASKSPSVRPGACMNNGPASMHNGTHPRSGTQSGYGAGPSIPSSTSTTTQDRGYASRDRGPDRGTISALRQGEVLFHCNVPSCKSHIQQTGFTSVSSYNSEVFAFEWGR
ncbi:hypothetical protein CYLTODRAFT_417741 [Cylindrobasidium torrendii FP15055 ss-10]|uniref:Uncharacterized protein n=1 Tax=Cylindrobasidium torrendii FP15055 ss-10 TaxID=1314674 RepID=A0A0D7BPQ4_9AGAR|nr:hypothetical protein CYLTODRAFT_417741 [Cylindrobasidium torrendii FP15055 ss-10]